MVLHLFCNIRCYYKQLQPVGCNNILYHGTEGVLYYHPWVLSLLKIEPGYGQPGLLIWCHI
jgi:hypothetical protein